MARLKFEMWRAESRERGYFSKFTDGNGIFTSSWWSSPMDSIDHVGIEYLSSPHRHPNVRNKRQMEFIKRRYKEEMKRIQEG